MKIRMALVSALAVSVMSACSSTPNIAGAAFVVGDDRISQSDVTVLVKEATSQIAAMPPAASANAPTTAQLSSTIVSRMLQHEIFLQAEQSDPRFKISPIQISRTREVLVQQYGQEVVEQQLVLSSGAPLSQIDNFVHDIVLSQVISQVLAPKGTQTEKQDAFTGYIKRLTKKAGVRVSPRFGSWNQESGKLDAVDIATAVNLTPANPPTQ